MTTTELDDVVMPGTTSDLKSDHERVVASTDMDTAMSGDEEGRPSSPGNRERGAAALKSAEAAAAADAGPGHSPAFNAAAIDEQQPLFDFAEFMQSLDSHVDHLDDHLDSAIGNVVDPDHLVALAALYERASGRVDAIHRRLRHSADIAALDRLHAIASRAACLDSMLALAEAGHAVSQHALALMYSERERSDQFEFWLKRAADSGHALSMMGMVSLLSQRDPPQSFAYARQAADAGLRTAQYIVGRCLIMGQGVAADFQAGLKYVVQAAEAGMADAQVLAGGVYIQQHHGMEPDLERAQRYFQLAADQNNPEALYILGSLLMAGSTGMAGDPERGAQLIKRAAEADNPRAQLDLGKMYNAGEHVQEDYDQGFVWCLRAAMHGLPMAAFIIGIMHLEGMGCERNILAGCHWIEKAAAMNHGEARKMLTTLLSDPKIEEAFQDWKMTQSLLHIMAPSLRINLVALT